MQLTVQNIGKHYNKQWLFRGIDFNLKTGESIAVLGKNGSGKSTLLQIIYGLIQASEGHIKMDDAAIENPHLHFNLTSPLLYLPLEFNLREVFDYHLKLGKVNMVCDDFMELSRFSDSDAKKPLRYFSSGMLQRLKTAFCLFSANEIKLLDEPLSNMDKDGENWYLNCIENIRNKNILIVASNNEAEYKFTDRQIAL